MKRPLVVVFGGARVSPESDLYRTAYTLGARLAQAGFLVASGGYQGVMEAVSRGAAEAGGYVVGYTCDVFRDVEPNPWLHEERRTRTLTERIGRMAVEGDAFVAFHGGIGTLAEVTVVWNLFVINGIGPKPFVLFGPEWEPILATFREHTQMGSHAFGLIQRATTPDEAVRLLRDAFGA